MFKAILQFADKEDGLHLYAVGDVYPRSGYIASAERCAELASTANRCGQPVIVQEQEESPPEGENKPYRAKKKRSK